ncbi:tripartite tricarboxylate transporter substrate binding protein [Hydrogenophaga sp.]|uniref:Bug family tripartite tricarboxylate transporter substrate binding protein n=1 Tax=Hydrogenophaga sp. TaxID=1904254 RepID=UPI0027280B35|nr:tripartite tricarboxylate transporter substrate binding protein [Hydrogenophaga sp.]MDO9436416.1 tripartite tricarboxylate transporter substrate binding protein [Hydrogenophaga sp.]
MRPSRSRLPRLKQLALSAARAITVVLVSASCVAAWAETYPSRPVKIVIPFAAGGSNDTVGRFLGDELQKKLRQPFVVENRGGAGGVVGSESVAKAPADGYTLLLVSTPHVANPSIYKKMPYDALKSFAPVARLMAAPVVITSTPSLGFQTVDDLVKSAKSQPGKLSFVSSGTGSYFHLASEMFMDQTKTKLLHIPYKGAGPAMADVVAGHANISIGSVLSSLPNVKSGRLKALAVSGTKRQSSMPDVPTMAEAGYPGYEADNWWGLLAPAGTPAEVIDTLSRAIGEIMAAPTTAARFAPEGVLVSYQKPGEFARFMETETVKWTQIIKAAGITAE